MSKTDENCCRSGEWVSWEVQSVFSYEHHLRSPCSICPMSSMLHMFLCPPQSRVFFTTFTNDRALVHPNLQPKPRDRLAGAWQRLPLPVCLVSWIFICYSNHQCKSNVMHYRVEKALHDQASLLVSSNMTLEMYELWMKR